MHIIKLIALSLLLSAHLFAYQKGDTISEDMQKVLHVEKDKIYIIDFFASWCHSCEKEIPYISKVNAKIDTTKVEIIGVNVDKDIEKGKAFQEELKSQGNLTFRVIDDHKNTIIKEFKPIGMPALFYVKNSKIIDVIYGAVDNIDEVILADLSRLQND